MLLYFSYADRKEILADPCYLLIQKFTEFDSGDKRRSNVKFVMMSRNAQINSEFKLQRHVLFVSFAGL